MKGSITGKLASKAALSEGSDQDTELLFDELLDSARALITDRGAS
jgi:hypothetical protein